ncbi:disco-interacting protein 2 homolog B-like [Rhincodon typus]|uniref:disco-interacting protein 2 homolog B-like n=1 Tax=Rhincodon typus TaxID=259920 RepID=UPI00202FA008|nr:disco-interacting protein 2 homolog B-like [Rhincodon typus]
MIVDVSKAACILTTQIVSKLLRSKDALTTVDLKSWPVIIDTDDLSRKKPPSVYKPPTPEMLAYLDFSISTTGMLTGVKIYPDEDHIFRLKRNRMHLQKTIVEFLQDCFQGDQGRSP